jgi:hypothetical protein
LGRTNYFEYPLTISCHVFTHLYLNDLSSPAPSLQNIGDLTKLQGLDLHNNFFEGTLSSQIGDLQDLRVLYLDDNSYRQFHHDK